MSPKIKKAFAVVGAVFTVIACTFYLVFLRRRDADGLGSERADERDSRITEGLSTAEGKIAESRAELGEVRTELGECRSTAERCEEHLRRAEEILREAIARGEKEKH